jgi:hypothetical protein
MPAPLIPLALATAPIIMQQQTDKQRIEKDFRKSKDRLGKLKAEEQTLLGQRQFGVGDAYNQFLAASKQDKAADLLRQQASEQEAAGIGALKAGGAKALLGGLGALQASAARNRALIEADSQARQQAALQTFAGVQQRAQDANVELAASDLDRTRKLKDIAKLEKETLRGEKRRQKDDRTNTAFETLDTFLSGKHGMKTPEYGNGGFGKALKSIGAFFSKDGKGVQALFGKETNRDKPFFERDRYKRAAGAFGAGVEAAKGRRRYTGLVDLARQQRMEEARALEDQRRRRFMTDAELEGGGTGGSGEFGGGSADNLEIVTDSSGNPVKNAQGQTKYRDKITGETRFFKAGGVQKTPGEFSHSKNPIDIMKDGAKIGEMTGGEYIFNPRQASTLQSLASKGGSPLHKYVRNLLKEFDKR